MSDADIWFDTLDTSQHILLSQLRAIILSTHPIIREELKWGQPCYSVNKLFCYLQKAKGHVTIGFQQGANLPDQPGLLSGDGKNMRFVKIPLGGEVPESGLRTLLTEALEYDASLV